MAVVMVGPFMALLDGSVINVALPAIMTTFGVNIDQVKWVATAFMLATAVGMPLTGWLGRRIGLGRTYLLEMAVFTSGMALAALSWNLNVLVFARVVEGIGAGSLMPTSLAIVTSIYPAEERGKAIGIWGIGFMLAPAMGPTLGGILTDWFDWRAIFAVNLPLAFVAMLVASITLDPGKPDPKLPFDFKGYLSLVIFLVAGLLTLEQGNELGWVEPSILMGIGLSSAGLLVFIALAVDEPHPILPLRLFRNLDFSLAIWLGMTRATGLFGTLFLLPIFLQTVQARDPFHAGLLMIPAPLAVAATMPVAGILTDRFGPRWLCVAGVALVSWSLYLYSSLDPLSSGWDVIWPQIPRGMGMGLMNTPVSTTAMNAVRKEDTGAASWIVTITRMLTASVVIALVGTLLPSLARNERDRLGTADVLREAPPAALMYRSLELGHGGGDTVRAAQGVLLRRVNLMANTLAFQRIHVGLSLLILSGLIPALLITGNRREA